MNVTTKLIPDNGRCIKLSIAVVATMSSGKSTTLNAILGMPLLPAKNEACTAVLTRIEDVDGMTGVQARVTSRNGEISPWQAIHEGTSDCLAAWNCADNRFIDIQLDVPHIDNHFQRIEFLDTPGPNNSTDRTHAQITHDIITQCQHGYLVFVMNATQFGVDDERSLLEKLYSELQRNGKSSKIVFAVNKVDQLDFEAGEKPAALVQSVKRYLEDIGFSSPNIIPIMSRTSLELRQCLQAHRQGIGSPFGLRTQRRIVAEIKVLLDHFDLYLDALINTGNHDAYMNCAFAQNRKIGMSESITIAGEVFTAKQLLEADLLTGIPLLEEMLELELMRSKSTPARRRKTRPVQAKNLVFESTSESL